MKLVVVTSAAVIGGQMFHPLVAVVAAALGLVWIVFDVRRHRGTRADGLNTIFGSAIPTGRSIQVDQSRIELVVKGRAEPVLVNRDYISSTLAHENIRAIKVFLRKAGWLPADERPLEDRPKKKKKKDP